MDDIQEYQSRHAESKKLYERACKVAVDGAQAPGKVDGPYPIYTAKAQGSHLWDVDGNEYVDYILGLGPMLLGHGHPAVTQAIQSQMSYVLNSTPTGVEVELAERLMGHIPCAEKIRYTASGTEANMLAVRLARSFTGRDILLRVTDDYVGWADSLMPGLHIPAHQPGAGRAWGLGGVPKTSQEQTHWFDFNDTEGFKSLVSSIGGDRIAAVIMEPAYRASMAPQPGFLETIRSVTKDIGAMLIFDEVVTGFRYGMQGGQGYFNVIPDLASFGKAISGGIPLGILAGRKDVMERMSTQVPPEERVYHSGTWPGMPLASVAAMAVLDVLEQPGTFPQLFQMGERLRTEIQDVVNEHEVPMRAFGVGPVLEIAFTDEPVVSPKQNLLKVEPQIIKSIWMAMAMQGVLTVGKGYIPAIRCFVSLAHTDEDIKKAVDSMDKAIKKVFGR